jgi:hypothetical protein
MMRRLLTIALALAGAVLTVGVAHAAPYPSDHANPAPVVAPKGADYPYPEFSLCYDLTPAAPTLARKECFLYDSATGVLVPDSGKTSIYPVNGALPAPAAPAVAPITAGPAPQRQAPVVAGTQAVAPGPVTPLAHAEASTIPNTVNGVPVDGSADPSTTICVPNAVRGMPGFDPTRDGDNNGVSCETTTTLVPDTPRAEAVQPRSLGTGTILGIGVAVLAAAMLVWMLTRRVRPDSAGRHKAP